MSDGGVSLGEAGELRLSGILDYRTGPELLRSGKVLIGQSKAERLVVDCSAVDKSSSVGVSLLLAYMRLAKKQGRELDIVNLPQDMAHIAEVSGLQDILSLES
ncbi:STAS domain-containing protein [Azomonas macrocytogenes]|uniref:Phospholipid transport system transporter-binding protein n=1 Tax=Azomonas macrocytogenes TaxID=69962 RepID=A0A839T580_AZOMA|nr:STAS domain-containing protein [Azomonas macrocytogenes]MBB3104681.1 phospholipid transport system transporter-binding protein [Azomonas macrocytogenes]